MSAIRNKIAAVRWRISARRLPKVVTVTAFDQAGVKFEAVTGPELHSVLNLGYEGDYLRAMLDALGPDDTLYDVGANIGLLALHAARRCRTIAFEPDPHFLERLRRNLALNPDLSVDVQGIAIADTDGTVTLFRDSSAATSSSIVDQRGEGDAVEVPSSRLASLVASRALPAPTVVKLDIEGAEMLAIRGAQAVLQGPAAPRALFMEVHRSFLPAFGSSADELLDVVNRWGYGTVRYEAERGDQLHLILERS